MGVPEFKTYFQTFQVDLAGHIFLTGILNVETFSKVNLLIVQFAHASVNINAVCFMGKLSGETLAETVGEFSVGSVPHIHTFDVIGPEFSVLLSGPPGTVVPVQAWVFLH